MSLVTAPNSSSVASSFLAELLALIFQECVYQAHSRTTHDGIGRSDPFHFCWTGCLSWIRVTHVCRHWRHTALSHPSLWTRIPTYSTYWRELFIARAGSCALQVSANINADPDLVDLTQPSEALGQRMQEIVLRGTSTQVTTFLDGCGSLPLLLSLSMSLSPRSGGFPAARLDGQTSLPEHFLSDRALQLRSLCLHSCILAWKSPPSVFFRITSLSIHRPPFGRSPGVGELLSLLSAIPMLEQLVLDDCLKDLSHGPGQTVPVTARNLRYLKFIGSIDVLREVLSHIQVSQPLTQLHVENRKSTISRFSYFLPCIAAWHIPKLNSPEAGRSQYELSLIRKRVSPDSDPWYGIRALVPKGWDVATKCWKRELYIDSMFSEADVRDIFQYLFTILPIRLLSSLNISTAGLQDFGLRTTLKNATSLRSLSIAPPDLDQVANLLACRSVGDMPARALEEITLNTELPSVFISQRQPIPTFAGLEELRQCILLRHAYGHPVRRVVFMYCRPEDSSAFVGMQWEKVEDVGVELVFIIETDHGGFAQKERYSLRSFLALGAGT